MSARKLALLAGITLVSLTTTLGQSPPPNDNFANRTVLTGASIAFTGTLAGATLETMETNGTLFPNGPAPGGSAPGWGSVWWTWTAPRSSTVVVQIFRDYSVFDSSGTRLIVYEGTNVNAWTYYGTASQSFDAPAGRYAQFSATAGTSYQFQVVGAWGSSFALKLTATNSPVFLLQPQDCTVSPYGSAFFSAMANLPHQYGYWFGPVIGCQWTFNGVPIPGETYPCLLIHGITTNNAGAYSMIASNAAGITVSASATLTVTDTNPVPWLAALPPIGSAQLPFILNAEAGRWHKIESSQDLQNWVTPTFVLPTNSSSLLSVSRLGPNHFVRASLDVRTEVCVAQLKQMQAAIHTLAIEQGAGWAGTYSLSDLHNYIRLNEYGSLPWCPDGGEYKAGGGTMDPVTCSLSGHGHHIDTP